MVKILVFLEAALPSMEAELNQYMKDYDIAYIWNTGSRLVVILKERAKPGRPKKED